MFGKSDTRKRFIKYAKELNFIGDSDLSNIKTEISFSRIMLLVNKLINKQYWEYLETIKVIYHADLIKNEDLKLFFRFIHYIAVSKINNDEKILIEIDERKKKLPISLIKSLDSILNQLRNEEDIKNMNGKWIKTEDILYDSSSKTLEKVVIHEKTFTEEELRKLREKRDKGSCCTSCNAIFFEEKPKTCPKCNGAISSLEEGIPRILNKLHYSNYKKENKTYYS